MARNDKSRKKEQYADLIRELRSKGPRSVYLLWGEEDYLREQFLGELLKECVTEGAEVFDHRRMDASETVFEDILEAVEVLPFLSPRTLVEVRDFDINTLRDREAKEFVSMVADIPETCTLALLPGHGWEPDGRLKTVAAVRAHGREIAFEAQGPPQLTKWLVKRFSSHNKTISPAEALHLMFISGELMSELIPEIEKVAAYAKGPEITAEDIEAVAHHLPEADVFKMTDALAGGDYDSAASLLSKLLSIRDERPSRILAVIGRQMRNLYAARLSADEGLGKDFLVGITGIRSDYVIDKLTKTARGFCAARLERAVKYCTDAEYEMKSGSENDENILIDLLLKMATDTDDD